MYINICQLENQNHSFATTVNGDPYTRDKCIQYILYQIPKEMEHSEDLSSMEKHWRIKEYIYSAYYLVFFMECGQISDW